MGYVLSKVIQHYSLVFLQLAVIVPSLPGCVTYGYGIEQAIEMVPGKRLSSVA